MPYKIAPYRKQYSPEEPADATNDKKLHSREMAQTKNIAKIIFRYSRDQEEKENQKRALMVQ